MNYEDALREWGARRIEAANNRRNRTDTEIDRSTVVVQMNFNEGYSCCGGFDPDCYCSFAESPSADIIITGYDALYRSYNAYIPSWDFSFATILKEIVTAGGGTVTET